VFINKQGLTDLKYREELWGYYSGEVDKSVKDYNEQIVEKRNKEAEETMKKIDEEKSKPWWRIL